MWLLWFRRWTSRLQQLADIPHPAGHSLATLERCCYRRRVVDHARNGKSREPAIKDSKSTRAWALPKAPPLTGGRYFSVSLPAPSPWHAARQRLQHFASGCQHLSVVEQLRLSHADRSFHSRLTSTLCYVICVGYVLPPYMMYKVHS